jgi:maleate isomerase
MDGNSLRVGLIVPSSNTVMEPDCHRYLGKICIISTCRIFLQSVTREAETRMLREDLPRSLRLIKTTAPHVTVFGCTSAGSLGGTSHDAQIARIIEQETGSRALTVVGSVLSRLRRFQACKVAVLTPYQEDLTGSVARCITENGFAVTKTAGMGILENREIGKVAPGEIISFVEANMAGTEADCVFLSCTNWRAIDVVGVLEERLGRRVISSNQAVVEDVRDIAAEGTASTE